MWQDAKALNATASGIFVLTLLACIAAGVWWVAQRPMFTLRTIRIETIGQDELKHVNHLTLRSNALGRIKGNFFTTNLDAVRQAFESVPWVRRATVRREWPDQLIVALEEHEALGTWGEDGKLLSTKGDVFTANLAEAEEDHTLPEFDGPDGSEKEVLSRYDELRTWFAPLKLVPEALSLSGRYAWTVKLNNGMSVALGREQTSTTLKERVDRLMGIYPQLVEHLQNIETIDMRYQNGLALSAAGLKIPAEGAKPKAAVKKNNVKPQH
ncbi:cell division protein FtsQ/DivIB [Duganella sp. BJB488]|uniref:Cell division protein FtsQ n=1 Tax=Duganella vulcania TaxID=2692166 RepID=A0A845HCW8_9BURK|nr:MULTISPECIES: cell division protein FtsQ/DivIB [Duganella]MYN16097.1 FtsQ-type POTRA domain-containing protein [Duganella vulcania]RFP22939.1 cell division protein FtsQ/DivIB [Duganella sp. BJB489]RFP24985.1 cell division protein FtsQ/DivIB [Duganella sp. BJB488]RFP33938.1 cell division protein FtsQ/DivIB [Duganella sp. BJB480]